MVSLHLQVQNFQAPKEKKLIYCEHKEELHYFFRS